MLLLVLVQVVRNEWITAALSLMAAGLSGYVLYLVTQMDAEWLRGRKRA
jgi:hypothetical protein